MPQQPDQLTAAEISRLAGVTRATVSNWRRRHPDFPQPSGGTETSPAYDRRKVESWLAARGQLPTPSPEDELRAELRRHPSGAAAADRLLSFVLGTERIGPEGRTWLLGLPAADLLRHTREAIRAHAPEASPVEHDEFQGHDVPLLSAALQCVHENGAIATLNVLAEHQPAATGVRGSHYTPEPLTDLMADLVDTGGYPKSVLDPACGSGNLLAAAARRGAETLHGQDIAPGHVGHAAVRLSILAPEAEVRIRSGDSLRRDAFPELAADAILCNPPYGDREWGHEELGLDQRWEYGLSPKSESELAWAQHCLAHLEPGALAVMLMPPGVAERVAGRKIRAELVRRGALRAIMALPAGTAQPLHIGLHLWVLQRPSSDKGKAEPVLFVDSTADDEPDGRKAESSEPNRLSTGPVTATSGEHKRVGRKALVWEDLQRTVLMAWRKYFDNPEGFEIIPGAARVVFVPDLLDEMVDLTPARHVRTAPPAVQPDQHAETGRALRSRLRRAADALAAMSGGQGWEPAGAEPVPWRTAAVADLIRGGALTLHRATSLAQVTRSRTAQAHIPHLDDDIPAVDLRVITARDVTDGRSASSRLSESRLAEPLEVRRGDVLLTEMFQGGVGAARVADEQDIGCALGPHLLLLRVDPQRLDSWFLAGFVAAEKNLNSAAVGSTIKRIDARRLRVPLLPLEEQRQYGTAFRRLRALRKAADLAERLAAETVRELGAGLTSGSLLPPSTDQPIS
jgi:methylase of polypeptide subunit release factors